MIELVIPGEPVAKARPRVTRYGTYNPIKCVNYETYIKELFVISYPDFVPLEGPLRMTITAWMMIPKSTSKKKAKLMEERAIRPTKTPDADNILKAVFDALGKGLAYDDDKQIVTAICHKYYSMRPRLEIEITGAKI